MITPACEDLVFSALMLFGAVMCGAALWRAIRHPDPFSEFAGLAPLFGGFMFFPLVNTMIGVVLLGCWLRGRWKAMP